MVNGSMSLELKLCTAIDRRKIKQWSAQAVWHSLTRLRLAIEYCYKQNESACFDVDSQEWGTSIILSAGRLDYKRRITDHRNINNSRDALSECDFVASIRWPVLFMNRCVASMRVLKYRYSIKASRNLERTRNIWWRPLHMQLWAWLVRVQVIWERASDGDAKWSLAWIAAESTCHDIPITLHTTNETIDLYQ
jgi:hypothetical protein